MQNWLLPEYVEDILSPEARRLETMRRHLLDLFHAHGYEFVIPPLLEHLPSLLSGTGQDLHLKTFKVVDQLSGHLLGIRADMSPQMARIDAHVLNRRGVTRLCYAGSVLHTLPEGVLQNREPYQLGAELFGHAGIEADIEIQRLMLDALASINVAPFHLDLGHVGIVRDLVGRAALDAGREEAVLNALQLKDRAALAILCHDLEPLTAQALIALPDLFGGPEILARARAVLPASTAIAKALTDLEHLLIAAGSTVEVTVDLADLHGYYYHNGVVFAAYATGWAHPIARGGRYDNVGKLFGRARPATGFSLDLRALTSRMQPAARMRPILAPCENSAALQIAIAELQQQGEVVVLDLPGHASHQHELNCDRQLVLVDGRWQVVSLADTESRN